MTKKVKSNIIITKCLSVYKDFRVRGYTLLCDDVTANHNFGVHGRTTLNGNTCINHNLHVNGCTNLNGNTTINHNLLVRGNLTVEGETNVTDINVINLNVTNNTTINNLTVSGTLIVNNFTASGNSNFENLNVSNNTTLNNLSVSGITTITNTTQSTSCNTGALVVDGGVGIEGNLYVCGTIYQSGSPIVFSIPVGTIFPFAGSITPSGFLLCDGSQYTIGRYQNLFNVIGNTYTTSTIGRTFNVPNFTNRMPVGANGIYNLGDASGNTNFTLTNNELPSHFHTGTAVNNTTGITINDPGHNHTVNGKQIAGGGSNPGGTNAAQTSISYNTNPNTTGITLTDPGHNHSLNINPTGLGNSFSLMNPYLAINFIIKY